MENSVPLQILNSFVYTDTCSNCQPFFVTYSGTDPRDISCCQSC